MAIYRRNIRRNLGSHPVISVVFSTTLALFVVGLLGLLLLHAASFVTLIKENVRMQVYLHKNIAESEIVHINQLLSSKDFVLKKDGRTQLRFLSKEEAAKEFIQATKEDFLQVLDENPLRDAYVIGIAPNYQAAQTLQTIKHELEAINGIFEVDYAADFVSSLNHHITRLGSILATFSMVLLAIVGILINNTIRLAVYSQRFLVRSMYLVGATAFFIKKPFLIRATLTGLMAGTIASIFLVLSLHTANKYIESLVSLQDPFRIFMLVGLLLALGISISLIGTYRAVDKYLNMSLDDLY